MQKIIENLYAAEVRLQAATLSDYVEDENELSL